MNSLLRHLPLLVALACGFASGAASAQAQQSPTQDPPVQDTRPERSPLRINGFGTFGVTSTHAPDGWRFRRDAAQYPLRDSTAFDTDSRLGLQAHYEVNPQLELASQLVIKRRLTGSKPLESVEWLYAAYQPAPDWTVRVGRTTPDLFLLSDYRNVGVAYPWVRPNIEMYSVLAIYAVDGADASYVWHQGDARWRIKGFAGSADAHVSGTTSPAQATYKLRAAGGLILSRDQDGLVMRATLAKANMSLATISSAHHAQAVLDSLKHDSDPTIARQANEVSDRFGMNDGTVLFTELGLSYDRNDWLLSAEYGNVLAKIGRRDSHFGYVSVGRRFGDFTVFGVAGRLMSTAKVLAIPDWSSIGAQTLATTVVNDINASRTRQSSLSLGTRWDVQPQMALKFQVDHYWVASNGGGLWVGPGVSAAQPNVLSATLDFTF